GEGILMVADATRLTQVFDNLLNNAAKYTDRGGRIRLAVERQGDVAVVSITDSGIGIAAEMLGSVFEMFSQVDTAVERAQGGLGLGLNIVKRLVEKHGGTVEATSGGKDEGSTFVVRLPVAPAPEAAMPAAPAGDSAPAPSPAERAGRRVLVVDDNRDAAITLKMMIDLMGSEARLAYGGLEALAIAEDFRPELGLLDIGMPGLNGYDTARRLREQPWGRDVVLVALTGWGQNEDRQRSREAGFDDHVVKPIEPAALEQLLAFRRR
ncbi:MAG: ATP-binding protein, partial [Candidatus Eisenbacteria bacterium]